MSTVSSINSNNFSPLINNLTSNSSNNLLSENISQILEKESSISTISKMGEQINKIYSFAKSTKDEDTIEGFKTAMFILNSQMSSSRAINFFKTAENLTYTNAETFSNLFSTVNSLNKNNQTSTINSFIDAINTISDKFGTEDLNSFLEKTQKLSEKLGSEDRLNSDKTMFSYLNTVKDIVNSSKNTEENESLLNTFLQGVNTNSSISAIDQYIQNFRNQNLS